MKTTIVLKDNMARQLKSRAALRGQSLSSFIEEKLKHALAYEECSGESVSDWILALPKIEEETVNQIAQTLADAPFSRIDDEQLR